MHIWCAVSANYLLWLIHFECFYLSAFSHIILYCFTRKHPLLILLFCFIIFLSFTHHFASSSVLGNRELQRGEGDESEKGMVDQLCHSERLLGLNPRTFLVMGPGPSPGFLHYYNISKRCKCCSLRV